MSPAQREIRALAERDVPAILEIERISFPDPWSRDAFVREIRPGPSGYSRVLTIDGDLAGYMISWFVADEAHLANIAVARAQRRLGVAAELIEDLMRESERRGVTQIVLEVRVHNDPAIRLYEEFGSKRVAIRRNYYSRQGEDAFVMIRRLGPEEDLPEPDLRLEDMDVSGEE